MLAGPGARHDPKQLRHAAKCELGRFASPGPFVSSMVAADTLDGLGLASRRDDLLGGTVRAGFARGDTALDVRPGDLIVRVDAGSTSIERVVELDQVEGIDPAAETVALRTPAPIAEQPGQRGLVRAQVLLAAHARTPLPMDRVVPFIFLQPIVGVLLSSIWLNEAFTLNIALGTAGIVGGLVWNWRKSV